MSSISDDSNTQEDQKIKIILTDLRESTYEGIERDRRVQKSVNLTGIVLHQSSGTESLRDLSARIKHAFGLKEQDKFVVCNPQHVEITHRNVNLLKTNDPIFILDFVHQPFPLTYSQKVDATPHSQALTNQDGVYYGRKEHNVAALALAELIDNSLAATANNEGKREIELRFYDHGIHSSLHILDNGSGMDFDSLQSSLKFKAPKASRRQNARNFGVGEADCSQLINDSADDIHPRYNNSNISKFGAGMKQSAFKIGRYLRIMTKRKETVTVHDVSLSKDELVRRESSNGKEKPWEAIQKCRNPGELIEDEIVKRNLPWTSRDLVGQEKDKSNFTHIIVAQLYEGEVGSPLENLRRPDKLGTTIEGQLAHIYHYYIHGRNGKSPYIAPVISKSKKRTRSTINANVDIIIKRFKIQNNEPELTTCLNLRDIPTSMEDLESKFIRTAADTFNFAVDIAHFNQTAGKPFKIGGIIRYHPYHFDGETHPEGDLTRKIIGGESAFEDFGEEEDGSPSAQGTDGFTEDDETDEGLGQRSRKKSGTAAAAAAKASSSKTAVTATTGAARKRSDFFYIWWNGRLIPIERLDSFDWCSPSAKLSQSNPLYKCYDRLSGSLFFDSNVDVTANKLNLANRGEVAKLFDQKRIGGDVATFMQITIGPDNVAKSTRMDASKVFYRWLENCHKKYDKQVMYSDYFGDKATKKVKYQTSCRRYYQFGRAEWLTDLKVGDAVQCIRRKPHVFGRIKCFLLEMGEVVPKVGEKTPAPLCLVQIEQLPAPLYGAEDAVITKCMTEIDTTATIKSVADIIRSMEKDLKMKLELHSWGSGGLELEEGAEIPLDGVLFDELHVKVRRSHDSKEVLGALFHPSAHKAKKMFLFARIYKVEGNGNRETTFYTSEVCKWNSAYKGFFFKSINLKTALYIKHPGKYMIKILSYIDVREEHLKSKAKVQGGGRGRKSQNAGGTTPNPNLQLDGGESPEGDEEGTSPSHPDSDEEAEGEGESAETWEEGMDNLGRHTLHCGGDRIPMPISDGIAFKIVAGAPSKFSIESIEEDRYKIGEPFDIVLSLEDYRGNKTAPTSCADLVPKDEALVFSAPGPKSTGAGANVSFTYKDLILQEKSVVVRGVVASAVLESDDILCRVAVRLQWKNKKLGCKPYPVRFSSGAPTRIHVAQSKLVIENGMFPAVTCHVTDHCGNLVSHILRGPQKIPIKLNCDIYKGKKVKGSRLVGSASITAADSKDGLPQKIPYLFNVEELRNREVHKMRFVCRISIDSAEGDGKSAIVLVPIKVCPSTRPERLRIYQDGGKRELMPGSELKVPVTKDLTGLTFKILDGMGNEVVNDPSKYRLKFDWPKFVPARDVVTPQMFAAGTLPVMKLSTAVKTRHECTVTLASKTTAPNEPLVSVVHKMYLTTLPGHHHELKVSVKDRSSSHGERAKVKVDELESKDLVVSVLDKYGNVIKEFEDQNSLVEMKTPDFYVSYVTIACVDDPDLAKVSGTCVLRHVAFLNGKPPLGPRDFDVKFGHSLKATLPLEFVPGKPVALAFEIDGQIMQGGVFTLANQTNARVRVHLKDKYGYSVPLKLKCVALSVGSKMVGDGGEQSSNTCCTDQDGIADFKFVNVGMKSGEVPTPCTLGEVIGVPRCAGKCYNLNPITATCEAFGGILNGSCTIHIICRPDIPFKLNINCSQFVCSAGAKFDELTATLAAEDDSLLTAGTKLEDLALTMTSIPTSANASNLNSSRSNHFQLAPAFLINGTYHFGNAPEKAGKYRLEFAFNDGKTSFTHGLEQSFRIRSLAVAKLEPQNPLFAQGRNVCVSNDPEDRARRTIATDLTLALKDKYQNSAARFLTVNEMSSIEDSLTGKLKMEVFGQYARRLRFENAKALFAKFPISDGIAFFPDVILSKDSDLPNNSKHMLKFTANLRDHSVFTYELEFTFYNDIAQQQERQGLENLMEDLEKLTQSRESRLKDYNNEVQKLKAEEGKAKSKEVELRSQHGLSANLTTVADIAARECSLVAKQRALEIGRRGTESNLERWDFLAEPNVLGVIGLLAKVKSEGEGIQKDVGLQTVLSWHLQMFLSVTVVLTSQKALELEGRFKQRQFMILDSNPVDESMHWDERDQIPVKLRGFGNPKFARDLLHLTSEGPVMIEQIRKVFNLILERTVIVNTLVDANNYREAYNNSGYRSRCPIILTRDGNRLGKLAIIGGSENRAPALRDLRHKFGLAPSEALIQINKEMKALTLLTTAVKTRLDAERNVERYVATRKEEVDEIESGLEECRAQKQDLEHKLIEAQSQIWNSSRAGEGAGAAATDSEAEMEVSSSGMGITPSPPSKDEDDGEDEDEMAEIPPRKKPRL